MEVLWFPCLGKGKQDASSFAKRGVLYAAEETEGRSIQKAFGGNFCRLFKLVNIDLIFLWEIGHSHWTTRASVGQP